MQVERWAEGRRRGRELIGWGAGLITLMQGRCEGKVRRGEEHRRET